MNTQYRKNLKAVATACKGYVDKRIDDLEWQMGTYNYDVDTDSNVARIKTLPSDTYKSMANYIGGKTVKYNQLVQNGNFDDDTGWSGYGGTISANNNILTYTVTSTPSVNTVVTSMTGIVGHKYLLLRYIKSSVALTTAYDYWGTAQDYYNVSTSFELKGYIFTYASGQNLAVFRIDSDNISIGTTVEIKQCCFIDLTDKFGADNEPSDVASAIPLLKANGYKLDGTDTYSTGDLKHAITTSVNFLPINVWDNEIEIGAINSTTGQKENNPSGNYWRSKNYFEVIANQTYFVKQSDGYTTSNANMSIYFYDENYNFIIRVQNVANNTIVIPSNCKYIMFQQFFINATQTTPTGICINISNASYNGNYYPYVAPITKAIPSQVLALDGYGLGISNTLYNYIDFNSKKFIKKVARVDLSTLNFEYNAQRGVFYAPLNNSIVGQTTTKNIICDKYNTETSTYDWTSMGDKTIMLGYAYAYIYLKDSSLNGNTSLINGIAIYQLATPVETDISQYLTTDFKVDLDKQYATCEMVVAEPIDMPNSITNLIKEVKA